MDMSTYTYEENGRNYIDPNVSLSEQQEFMKNLKEVQQQNNQQIYTDTHNLGTDISSNLGGLTGAESYFTSRYQTPQTNSLVSDLRAAAQAQALNQALNNELDKAKKRYNDAYRAAKKRANTNGNNPSDDEEDGDVGKNNNKFNAQSSISVSLDGTEDYLNGQDTDLYTVSPPGGGYTYTYAYPRGAKPDGSGKVVWTDDPMYYQNSDGYYYIKGRN